MTFEQVLTALPQNVRETFLANLDKVEIRNTSNKEELYWGVIDAARKTKAELSMTEEQSALLSKASKLAMDVLVQ